MVAARTSMFLKGLDPVFTTLHSGGFRKPPCALFVTRKARSRQEGFSFQAGCRQAGPSSISAKRSSEETESRMSEVKRHRNTPLWREIDGLRHQTVGQLRVKYLKVLARPRNLWVRVRGTDATCGRWNRRNAVAGLSHCGWLGRPVRGWTA
jgi:hypothetical protein